MGNKHVDQNKKNLLFQSALYEDYQHKDNTKYLEKYSIQEKKIKEKDHFFETKLTNEKSNYDEKFFLKKNNFNKTSPQKQSNDQNDKLKIDSEILQAFEFFQKFLIVKELECVKNYFIYFSI